MSLEISEYQNETILFPLRDVSEFTELLYAYFSILLNSAPVVEKTFSSKVLYTGHGIMILIRLCTYYTEMLPSVTTSRSGKLSCFRDAALQDG